MAIPIIMVFSSSVSDTPNVPPPVDFEVNVIWNFDKSNNRILVLLPPLISHQSKLFLHYTHLLKELRQTLLKLTSMNQTFIIITIPSERATIDIYQLEDICNLEVKPIHSLEQFNEPQFLDVISNEVLYYLPYNKSWFQENIITKYIDTVVEEYTNPFWNSTTLDIIQGIHFITQMSSCIRISALNIINNSFNEIDWIIVLGKLTPDEMTIWKELIKSMMDDDALATIYIIDAELYEIINLVKMSFNKPTLNIRKKINQNTIQNMWLNISTHSLSTYTFVAGRFNLTDEVEKEWHSYSEKPLHSKNAFYDIYAFDTLHLNHLQKPTNVIWYPETLLNGLSNDESSS